jgi:phosphoenolpyruvate carboxykinase (ATP)
MESSRDPYGLARHGISKPATVFRNLAPAALYEETLRAGDGFLSADGALVVRTGAFTGRAPNDKFIVRDDATKDKVWWGKVNRPIAPDAFERLERRVAEHLDGKRLFVEDAWAGADPGYRIPIRVISESAWHALFARIMFIRPPAEALAGHVPEFTVLHAPTFRAVPERDGTASGTFIIISFSRKTVLIGGTAYAGEIKKSIFTVLNCVLPQRGVLSMHCSANVGERGDVALFFGLSGTGKTTLSADPARRLIGDDEHGWSDHGVFNFEGGCYAKTIRLSAKNEPDIYAASCRFGTILENVVLDERTRVPDFDDDSITENTRAAYPIDFIRNVEPSGRGGHPKTIVMLTCDAFGVLPPIARLTPEQAMYHFLAGYTAKVAGTEKGVTEPKATFSTCFGAPFMALHPSTYAKLFGEKIARRGVPCYLVNTGWTGGPYGTGRRMPLPLTRALVRCALDGTLERVETREDPVFGIRVPRSCPEVPVEILTPRSTWRDPASYDAKAAELATLFADAFAQFADFVPQEVREAGPRVGVQRAG